MLTPGAKRMMRQYELVERVRKYNPHVDEDLLNRAYVYAMKAHGAQTRASGDPYFSHPLEVAAILTDLKLDDATIVAAVLHDTIEDTDATREEIDRLFGEQIGKLVEGLTKIEKLDLVTKQARQGENFRKLLLAVAEDVRVLLVKLADRLHNMRTLHFVPQEKRARIAQETLDIYAPLAGRMGMQRLREELEGLAFRHLMPEAHQTIEQRLHDLRAKNGRIIRRIEDELTKEFAARGITAAVTGRQKTPFSVWRKMERKSISFEQLSDIFGFRIIVGAVEDCYRALGIVHTKWPNVPGRFKDYISTPKQNDYRSIHTTVIGPGHQRVELQIRTAEMHEIARFGIAAHALYKDAIGAHGREELAQGKPRLPLAAGNARPARPWRQSRGVPGAYAARTVPGSGVLLHAQGRADRAAARRDADRLRLCRAHQARQLGGRRQDQRTRRAGAVATAEWRRGRDHPRRRPYAAGGLGGGGGDRQGARRHPARDARGRAPAICRARPPDRRTRFRARRTRLVATTS